MSDGIPHDTSGLRKLIMENPDLPLVILADGESSCADDSSWWYQSDVRFSIGEILDCGVEWSERIYSDRDSFEDDLTDYLMSDYRDIDDNLFEKLVKDKMAEYEPHWKKVICVWASN